MRVSKLQAFLTTVLSISTLSPALAVTLEEKYQQEIQGAGIAHFSLDNYNGTVTVKPSTSDRIVVSAKKRVKGLSESTCRDIMKDLEIRVTTDDGKVAVRTSRVNTMWYETSVTYTVELPATISANIETTNGAIEAFNREAKSHFETTNGSIDLDNSKGDVEAETTNGSVKLNDVTGNVRAETTNGSVFVKGSSKYLRANTTNGKVEMNIVPTSGCDIQAETTNGKILVRLPESTSANITADTNNGEVEAEGFSFTYNKRRNRAHTTLGDGLGNIRLETSNGDITINKR